MNNKSKGKQKTSNTFIEIIPDKTKTTASKTTTANKTKTTASKATTTTNKTATSKTATSKTAANKTATAKTITKQAITTNKTKTAVKTKNIPDKTSPPTTKTKAPSKKVTTTVVETETIPVKINLKKLPRKRKQTSENYPVRYKGISRVDSPKSRTYGWYVRVFYNGEKRVRFFSDGRHGGVEKAFQKALNFRNKAEKDLGKPRTDRVVVTKTYNNTTGIIGLHRKKEKSITKNGEIRYRNMYEITWCPEPNKMARTRVSIDKYGEEGALVKAYRIRRAKERLVYGKSIQPSMMKAKLSEEEEAN